MGIPSFDMDVCEAEATGQPAAASANNGTLAQLSAQNPDGSIVTSSNNSILHPLSAPEHHGSTSSVTVLPTSPSSDSVALQSSFVDRSDSLFLPPEPQPIDAASSAPKRRLFGQTLPPPLQLPPSTSPALNRPGGVSPTAPSDISISSSRTPSKSPTMSGPGPQISMFNYRKGKSVVNALKRAPTQKELHDRERARRLRKHQEEHDALDPPPKKEPKKVVVAKYRKVPCKNAGNNRPKGPVKGGYGAHFNPFGFKTPTYRVSKYSSLGHGTASSGKVGFLQQHFAKLEAAEDETKAVDASREDAQPQDAAEDSGKEVDASQKDVDPQDTHE